MPADTSPVAGARRALDLRLVAQLGDRHASGKAAAHRALEDLVDELERVKGCGGRPRLKLAAELFGVSRDTLRARLADRERDRRDAEAARESLTPRRARAARRREARNERTPE